MRRRSTPSTRAPASRSRARRRPDRRRGRPVALWPIDANALGQVLRAERAGTPLPPAQLARQIGMTSGATSARVDRLEAAGHVTRHRESVDRRRVTSGAARPPGRRTRRSSTA
ncbi:MarR family transcriptional regulator [Curtobacterium oceanosedimentum]|uniref:MarR family transcriptional regulator n=1 Tax=Curtobacterium oceanosedimentum TaxID=465820 RepID=UPI0033979196